MAEEEMAAFYGRGTILPAENFNCERAAVKLRKAMKGIGTDERAIIDVLVGHSNAQRQEIKRKYRSLYGRDLVEDIKTELGGHFEDLCVALLSNQIEFLADCLFNAVQGLGTDENCVIEILCTHGNKELEEIKSFFKLKYRKDLEEWLCTDTSGHYRHLVRCIVASAREENAEVNWDRAEEEAQLLYDGGAARFGVEDEVFTRVLCHRSPSQLDATLAAYERISGHSLAAAIKSEFSGDSRDTMLAIVRCLQSRSAYFALQINRSLRGIGTDDMALIRILVSRSEIDLENIKEAYLDIYKKDLSEDIATDTSGDFKKALLRILQP